VKSAAAPLALPVKIEARLRELVESRFDKISTVAIDIIGESMDGLTDPTAAVAVLAQHSLHSRYRLMNVAALKKAAQQPELRIQQMNFFLQAIAAAEDHPALDNLTRILPYFKFLGVEVELQEALSARRKSANNGMRE
jgi:hypothetical protein